MANLFFSVNFTIFFGIVIAPKEYPFIFRVEPGDERLELTAWKLDSVDKNPRWRTTLLRFLLTHGHSVRVSPQCTSGKLNKDCVTKS